MSETPSALHGIATVLDADSDRWDLADPRVGALAVDDLALPDLGSASGEVPVALTLVSTQGAAQLRGPLQWAARAERPVVGVRTTIRDLADPAGNVRRVVAAVDELRSEALLDDSIAVTVVLPPGLSHASAQAALDELSYADLQAGIDAGDPHQWASLVDDALDREVAFETLGGAWNPAAVLAATRACLDGDPSVGLLDADEATALEAYDNATLERTRRWCVRVDTSAHM